MFANFPVRQPSRLCMQAALVTFSVKLALVLPIILQPSATQALAQNVPSQNLEAAQFYQQGVIRYYRNDFSNAEAFLRKALERDPNMAEAYTFLGNIMLRQNRVDLAIQNYSESVRIDPNFAEGYFNLGLTLHKQGKTQAALTAYRQALAINPNMAVGHYNTGLLLQAQGNIKEAIAAYSQAIAFDNSNADAHFNLAIALQQDGQIPKAIQTYRRAIELAPQNATAYNNLGTLLLSQGQPEAAIKVYRQGVSQVPKSAQVYHNLGLAWYKQGKPKDANAALKRASKYYREQDNFAEAEKVEQLIQQISQVGENSTAKNDNPVTPEPIEEATSFEQPVEEEKLENFPSSSELPPMIEFEFAQ